MRSYGKTSIGLMSRGPGLVQWTWNRLGDILMLQPINSWKCIGASRREPHSLAWGPSSSHRKIFWVEQVGEKLPIPVNFALTDSLSIPLLATIRFASIPHGNYKKSGLFCLPSGECHQVCCGSAMLYCGHCILVMNRIYKDTLYVFTLIFIGYLLNDLMCLLTGA